MPDLEKDKWRTKQDTIQYFNTTASAYTELHGKEQQLKYHAALPYLPTTGEAILDLGCGTGLLSSFISTKSLYVGVDISSQMAIRAADRIHGHSNGHIICADAEYLPLRDSCFDTVVAFTILQNIGSPQNLLQEVSRVLKPNSIFILSALKSTFPDNMIKHLLRHSHLHMTRWLPTTTKDSLVISKKVTFYSKNTR